MNEPHDRSDMSSKAPGSDPLRKLKEGEIDRESLEIDARYELADKWLDAADTVAVISGDEEAAKYLDFLRGRHALGVPMPGNNNLYLIDRDLGRKPEDCVFVAPLLEQDKERLGPNDSRHDLFSSSHAGRYSEESHMLYLNPDEHGPLVMGIIALHELKHAYMDLIEQPDRSAENQTWEEEKDAWVFECRLMELLGGDRYMAYIRSQRDLIIPDRDNPSSVHYNLGDLPEDFGNFFPGLQDITPADDRLLRSIRTFHAFWVYFQDVSPDPEYDFAYFIKAKTTATHADDGEG